MAHPPKQRGMGCRAGRGMGTLGSRERGSRGQKGKGRGSRTENQRTNQPLDAARKAERDCGKEPRCCGNR